ncbi:hypothetical protein AGMMS49992_24510 [Clostridia bacterium]|nr:hypothetical protein AGMMS49992_24510 [Clostridia bacterium]
MAEVMVMLAAVFALHQLLSPARLAVPRDEWVIRRIMPAARPRRKRWDAAAVELMMSMPAALVMVVIIITMIVVIVITMIVMAAVIMVHIVTVMISAKSWIKWINRT